MPAKLKVFRTPIGFHDAYVAAPSQKAALTAWGADVNLFARGAAEVVTDPALTAEPLARPGEVVRKARGSIADHLAALPASKPRPAPSAKPARKTPPRPSRKSLDAAEAALEDAEQAYAAARAAVEAREAAIRRERRELDREHERTAARLEKSRARAEAAYRAAMAAWRDG